MRQWTGWQAAQEVSPPFACDRSSVERASPYPCRPAHTQDLPRIKRRCRGRRTITCRSGICEHGRKRPTNTAMTRAPARFRSWRGGLPDAATTLMTRLPFCRPAGFGRHAYPRPATSAVARSSISDHRPGHARRRVIRPPSTALGARPPSLGDGSWVASRSPIAADVKSLHNSRGRRPVVRSKTAPTPTCNGTDLMADEHDRYAVP